LQLTFQNDLLNPNFVKCCRTLVEKKSQLKMGLDQVLMQQL